MGQIKYKQGELEAKYILEKLGIIFDDEYHDDNSSKSMPDLRMKDGRFVEVTHTLHNNRIAKEVSNFNRKSIGEQMVIMQEAKAAYDRIRHRDYASYENAEKQFKKDLKTVKNHMGYDSTTFGKQFTEFNCDRPIINMASDNIIDTVVRDKGKLYKSDKVDLFVFCIRW